MLRPSYFRNTPVKLNAAILPSLVSSILLTLVGCSGGADPTSSFEYAVQGLYSAEMSPDGSKAIVGSINHGASQWQFIENERLFSWNHKKATFSHIIASAFSPETDFAITATPQTMVLWNAETGAAINYWTAPSEILDIDLLNNGNQALLGLIDHSAALFDVRNGGVNQVFYHDGRVTAVDASADGTKILTGSEDYSAKLWLTSTAEQLHSWEHNDEVQLVKLSPDGSTAFTMAKYDKAALWDTDSGEIKGEIPLSSTAIRRGLVFTAVAFSEDSRYLLTGTTNRIVQLWDTQPIKAIKTWQMPKRELVAPSSAAVLALAFGTRGNYYAITSDGFAHKLN